MAQTDYYRSMPANRIPVGSDWYLDTSHIPFFLACTAMTCFLALWGWSATIKHDVPEAPAAAQTPGVPVIITYADDDVGVRIKQDRFYLAATMWGEARNQGLEGMRAVGDVIVNRVGFAGADSIKSVVLSYKQFSCWNKGDPNRSLLTPWRLSHLRGLDRYRFEQALKIADEEIAGLPDTTHGARHYHEKHIRPQWVTSASRVIARVGSHVFYK